MYSKKFLKQNRDHELLLALDHKITFENNEISEIELYKIPKFYHPKFFLYVKTYQVDGVECINQQEVMNALRTFAKEHELFKFQVFHAKYRTYFKHIEKYYIREGYYNYIELRFHALKFFEIMMYKSDKYSVHFV